MEAWMAGSVHGPHRADVPPPYGVDYQRMDGLPPRPPGEGPRGVRRADVQGPPPFECGELHRPPRPCGDDVPVDSAGTSEGSAETKEGRRGRGPEGAVGTFTHPPASGLNRPPWNPI